MTMKLSNSARLLTSNWGFWIMVNGVPIPKSLVREMCLSGEATVSTDFLKGAMTLNGDEEVLRKWLPDDCFRDTMEPNPQGSRPR